MKNTIKLLIVDDHAIFRAGLRLTLEQKLHPAPEIREAANIAEALDVLRNDFAADLILTDLFMPGISGLDGVKLLKQSQPGCRVILMTALADRQLEMEALMRQTDAFISKTASPEQLLDLVRPLLNMAPTTSTGAGQPPRARFARLTARQIEVLNLLAQGSSNKVIARRLSLSENTVRVHVSAILDQLRCASRHEAAELARREGLISSV